MSRRQRLRLFRTVAFAAALIVGVMVVVGFGGSRHGSAIVLRSHVVHAGHKVDQGVGEGAVNGARAGHGPTATAAQASPAASPAISATPSPYASKCAGVSAAREVVISIRLQRMFACDRGKLVLTVVVTTGNLSKDEGTPTGTWRVYAKETNRWLSGPGYSFKVHFWMPFYGGYGFHDSPWQTKAYGGKTYETDGSHGCVHVPLVAMTWLYAWAPVGTIVHIVD